MGKYTCWHLEDSEDDSGRKIEAFDAEAAAKAYAEEQCSDDPDYCSFYESGVDVVVRGEGATLVYNVLGRSTMVFRAGLRR